MRDKSLVCQNEANTTRMWDQELTKASTWQKNCLGQRRSWGLKHVSDQSLLVSSMLITTAGGVFSPLRTLHLESFSGPMCLHPFHQTGARGGGSGGILQRSRLQRFPITQNLQAVSSCIWKDTNSYCPQFWSHKIWTRLPRTDATELGHTWLSWEMQAWIMRG